jgi:hypothetical protein
MNRLLLVGLLFCTVAFAPSAAFAWRYGRGYGYMPYGGTVAGSQAAGMGAMIRAQGAYNQMTAEAKIAAEQAKQMALDNKLKVAQTNYQLHRLNENERALQARKESALHAPVPPPKTPRLTAHQLDPVTGQITWAPVLEKPEFAAERTELDDLFARRAVNPAAVTHAQVMKLTDALRDKLDAEHDRLPTADFFTARHFLEALEAESRYSGFEGHPDAAAK